MPEQLRKVRKFALFTVVFTTELYIIQQVNHDRFIESQFRRGRDWF